MNAPFRDRSAWLLIVGAFEVLVGLLLLAMGAVAAFALVAMPDVRAATAASHGVSLAASLAVYPVLGVTALVLGLGLVACRRWARVLTVIAGWATASVGTLAALAYVVLGPRLTAFIAAQPGAPAGAALPSAALLTFVLASTAVGLLVVPGALVAFLAGSEDARRTCEARDARPRWTDRCPPSVLALSLLFGGSALSVLPLMGAYPAAVAGRVVDGPAAVAVYVAGAVLASVLAVGLYRLRPWAWTATVVAAAVGALNGVAAVRPAVLRELYGRTGVPEAQLDQVMHLLGGPVMPVICGATLAAFAAWLALIRKHFVISETPTT